MGGHQALCAHHHYEEGLLGLAHMNGVKVYASITGVPAGKKWGVEKVKEEEKISEVFATLASSEAGRIEVSLLKTSYCVCCAIDMLWMFFLNLPMNNTMYKTTVCRTMCIPNKELSVRWH